MKKLAAVSIAFLTFAVNCFSQQDGDREKYGNTLNLAAGIGYYNYIGHSSPFGTLNYEVDVARNFTLAPFIGFYSYSNTYYWGNPGKPIYDESYRYYRYRETVVPLGLKGTYYFDELLTAGSDWDFYGGASLGFNIRKRVWDDGYYGDRYGNQTAGPLYLDAHIGAEYHVNNRLGVFLDLSTGVSTLGVGIHF